MHNAQTARLELEPGQQRVKYSGKQRVEYSGPRHICYRSFESFEIKL